MSKYYYPEERIAVVGIGGIFPDATNIEAFWNNILDKKISIKELPEDIVDKKIYYRPDVRTKIRKDDKTYTIMGSLVDQKLVRSASMKYKIPPAVAEYMDENQHAAIYCVDQALQSIQGKPLPKESTAVILSTGTPAFNAEKAVERVFYAAVEDYLRNNPLLLERLEPSVLDQVLQEISAKALDGNLPLTEDSTTGFLPNLVPGRVSNVFDLRGPAYTVDAACASTLAAVITSVHGLLRHEYDAAITGGIDLGMNAARLALFSAINALSPNGSFPFDIRANGFVMGQGAGVVVLKRLNDALRDHDNIIAVLSGYSGGSDGKGKYIAAPNEDGQVRVIQQACQMAGYPVDSIEMIEAHGTGTTVGDVVEVNALKKAFNGLNATRTGYCGIGSAKSNIGHLKAAAGAAGLVKATMALHHKMLPPTANVQTINPKLELEGSPFYILTEKRNWPENSNHPRRANVSAFGFGGADYHIAMEEFRPEFYRKIHPVPSGVAVSDDQSAKTIKNRAEVVLFSGDSLESLTDRYRLFVEDQSDNVTFSQKAFMHNAKVTADHRLRLAICAVSYGDLTEKWTIFEEYFRAGKFDALNALALKGIYFGQEPAVTSEQMAILFPGQASQYPNMGKELPRFFPMLCSFYAQVDALWSARYGYPVTNLIFGDDEAALDSGLKNTKNTHPAIFLSSAALYRLLSESGVNAGYLMGHSLGEMTALYAGEMLDLPSAISLIGARGFSFDTIPEESRGKMISVKADRETVEGIIREFDSHLFIANLNSPEQTVVGGTNGAIEELDKVLSDKKIIHTVLSVSHAFHTPIIAEAAEAFYQQISGLQFSAPRTKVVANHLQEFYPETVKGLKGMGKILKEQIVSSVRFTESIEKLYNEGVRVFVEVGPSTVLTNLVRKILDGKAVKVISTNPKGKDAVESYHQALAELFSLGVGVRPAPSQANLTSSASFWSNQSMGDEQREFFNGNPASTPRESLVYSGVSMGVPGSFKKIFADDNFEFLCDGRNAIEMLTDGELNRLVDLNITRLIKKEEASTFQRLSSINDVIRLAGKLGELDMLEDYLVDDRTLQQMTTNICAGVAAGYEALRDAVIPLIREWVTTASGSKIPGRWVLPKEMQDDTGIIFASCFTKVEPFIREVSKYIASKYGYKTRRDLLDFYEKLIVRVNDLETKKLLTDWFSLHYSRLNDHMGEEGVYEFNNDFMTQFSSLANNRLAQFIGASGPNFQLSAACSSTAYAITVAESLIRTGQAGRMIVIASENPTSETLLPWIGGGFLTSGAVTNGSNIYEAAVPFDNRRNGMIMGAGAVGIVIEKETEVETRGMNGICRLLGTHGFNLAGHQTRIDSKRFSMELERFISRMEKEYSFERGTMAAKTLYFSHETFTPKKGGCSQTEKIALETVFGGKFREIMVTNTKGMTGHTIGASIEEAVAAKSLQYQKVPPIVNYKEPDPELDGLRLSKGGSHSFEFALRMVAGFGGQGNYILMQKIAAGDERIRDKAKNEAWLQKITDSKEVRLGMEGRILVAKRDIDDQRIVAEAQQQTVAQTAKSLNVTSPTLRQESSAVDNSLVEQVLEIYAMVTKYPKEMLDLNMEMEADLGIDTVKQATIFAMIAEKFQMESDGGIQLSNYPTIGHMVELIASMTGKAVEARNTQEVAAVGLAYDTVSSSTDDQTIVAEVLKIISEVTKYPEDMLDLDMEMEADLGIDTVKQATIISYIAEKYGMQSGEGPQISSLPTIRNVVDMVRQLARDVGNSSASMKAVHPPIEEKVNSRSNEPIPLHASPKAVEARVTPLTPLPQNRGGAEESVLSIIAEVTKYPMEMLEPEMEMEADLGIDTVKQATIFSVLGERYGLASDEAVNISEYKTIGAVIDFVRKISDKTTPTSMAAPLTQEQNEEAFGVMGDEETVILENELCYQVPVAVEAEAAARDYSVRGKSVWVIGNNEDCVDKMAGFIRKVSKKVSTFVFEDPMDPQMAAQTAEIAAQPVDVMIDCGDLGLSFNTDGLSAEDEGRLLRLNSEARFAFYKELQGKLGVKPRIVCTVALDGLLGYAQESPKVINAYSGALSGFYKGLRKEWQEAPIKIVDLNLAKIDALDQETAAKVIQEVEIGGDDYEVAYLGKRRMAIRLTDLDQAESKALDLPENPHVLITGGANGITAEIALGLARQFKGCYTLIGRTALPENILELAALTEEQLNQKRLEIQDRLKRSEKKVTPIMVQKEFDKLTKAVAAYRWIQRIEQTGSQVRYFSCDVRSITDLQTVIEEAIKAFGPIHGLIHGAGIEKSHLLADKSLSEFQEVFSVKAEGICNLLRLVDKEQLRVLIGFSSISGRFGNEAQLDYCAANSFLSSYIRMIGAEQPHIHAVSIDWSGWKGLGMAWRNDFVKNHSEEMGVNLIEPARGVRAMLKVFSQVFNQQEIVISKGLKGFVNQRSFLSDVGKTPLIDWVTLKGGKIEKVHKNISVKGDPIFDHHRLGTTPLVPAVAMMEIIAEYHRLNYGHRDSYCFKNLSIMSPIKLFHDRSQEVFAEVHSEMDREELEVSLNSYFYPKIGDPKQVTHCRVTVGNKLGEYQKMVSLTQMLQEELTELPYRDADINPRWRFNNNIVLGTLFIDEYGKQNNSLRFNPNSMVYTYTVSKEQIENRKYQLENLLVNPCLMDTLFQAAAIHSLTQHDRVHLPMSAEEIGVIRVPRQVEEVKILARLTRYADECGTYDLILIDKQGEICYYAKNVMVQRINL